MQTQCPRCNWNIIILNLTGEQLDEIKRLIVNHQKLLAIQKLTKVQGVSLADAKGAIFHFNETRGTCHRCQKADLSGTYLNCPNCNAFNYNL